jgi:hypothetical protein
MLIVIAAILTCALFVAAGAFVSARPVNPERKEYYALVDFAKSHPQLSALLAQAAHTRYTEFLALPLEPADVSKHRSKEVSIRKWIDWMSKNGCSGSITNSREILEALSKIPKGTITLADSRDNPLMYYRAFLRVKYDGDQIIQVNTKEL